MQAATIIADLEKLLSQFFDSSNYDAQRKVEIGFYFFSIFSVRNLIIGQKKNN